MKFNIEVDMTPEELRRLLGMPDVSGIQENMINKIRDKMAQGVEGFDAVNLLKPYLPENLQALGSMQKAFWETVLKSKKTTSSKGPDTGGEKQSEP
ncbi:DUF6489 family protein [Exilibacterium tricleocarpae]|uniref:DUF6489 family protein n=1 Tax=Exilibacterium tricleocarpae TaxID=2591008 RepID=UPI0015D2AE1E|nr:DUF6489 family protein [Exilibacterium tricleocarpae]